MVEHTTKMSLRTSLISSQREKLSSRTAQLVWNIATKNLVTLERTPTDHVLIIVAEAKKLKTIKIVSYDWLAESLLSKHRRPRLVKEYLWTNILENEKKKTQKRNNKPKWVQREEPAEQAQTDGNETLGSYVGGSPGQKTGGPKVKSTKTRVNPIKKKRKRRSPGKLLVLSPAVLSCLIPKLPQPSSTLDTAGCQLFHANYRQGKSANPFDTKLRTPKAQTIAGRSGPKWESGHELTGMYL